MAKSLRDKLRGLARRPSDKAKAAPNVVDEAPAAALDLAEIETNARGLLRKKQFDEAARAVRDALARAGDQASLLVLLGRILREARQGDEALVALEKAQALDPAALLPLVYRGLVMLDRRDYREAVAAFEEATRRAPENGEHHRLLGLSLRFAKDFSRAGAAFEEAVRLSPKDPAAWADLAAFHEEQNRPADALRILEKGLADVGAHRLLVEAAIRALRRRGRFQDAANLIARLMTENEGVGWLHAQMAQTLQNFNRDAANAHFARALALEPDDARTLVAYADSLNRTRGPKEAENIAAAHQLALRRLETPGDLRPDARALMGVLIRNADFDSASRLGSFETLGAYYAEHGVYAALHLLLAQARTPKDRRDLVAWHKACGDLMIEGAARAPLTPPPAPPVVGRAKIRVGLMSSDLRDHPVGAFVRPLAQHYDRDKFEFHAYSWFARQPDAMQNWLTERFDAFRHAPAISDRDAAQLIANDRLDVLFDLGGSTDMNKLGVLAWRPAPRIASWLGYPHSAGLTTIDRILVDPYLEPKDPALLIERPLRLAHSWVAIEREGFAPAPIEPLTPQERKGRVTFGTMNNPYKYNRDVIAAWAQIMRRTPESRFLFVRPEGAVPAFRSNIVACFEANGVARDRIDFIAVRGRHLPYYNEIDVALDTFPQTGGTTTCECLWMGVPVVSLAGEAFFERLSCSNLSNAGLSDLVADSRAAYVDKAAAIAADTGWRRAFRRTVRDRLASYPLGDGPGFARDFQQAVAAWMDEARP